MGFSELGLSPEVLRAIEDAGYTEPTPIQQQAVPYALMGRDVLGCAQTGTGKTASFTWPMIETLSTGRARARMPRSLILTPTRELAAQIAEHFKVYGKYHKLTQALLIGGVSMDDQTRKLDRGVDVLIATPGRLLDHFERGRVLLSDIKVLVIDEADRMLDMGFIPDVERIVGLLPPLRQTLFFSATLVPEIRRLGDAFLHNPREVRVDPPTSPAELVNQSLVMVGPRGKGKALRTLLGGEFVKNALIFCNRKREVDRLDGSLRRNGFESAALHGDMPQPARTETLEAFKRGDVRFLVATDVAGRGLDIFGLSHVFNYDVPIHAEDYIHRIGRTGRAGHRGRAITLAVPDDAKPLAAIVRLIKRDIPLIEIGGETAAAAGGDFAAAKPGPRTTINAGRVESAPAAQEPRQKDKPQRGAEGPKRRTSPRRKEERAATPKKDKAPRGPVVGLGDHVPAFLKRPVDRRR